MMMTTSNKRTATASMLPEEMVTEILLRLPVKAIIRFHAVCPRWAALLSSEEFCVAKNAGSTEPAKVLFLPPNAISTEVRSSDGMLLLTLNGRSADFAGMPPATCHGLTLLHDHHSDCFHVFNAATRSVAMLPGPPCQIRTTAGLGYDGMTKKYKVVRLFPGEEPTTTRIMCEVYTLGEDSWRPSAEGVSVTFNEYAWDALARAMWYQQTPVFADRCLHWLIGPGPAATWPEAAVLSFSVADETFSLVRSPPFDLELGKTHLTELDGRHLTELDGRLCMVRDLRRDRSQLEIWKVSPDGGWSLDHRIDLAQQHAGSRDLTEPLYVRVVGSVGKPREKVIFVTPKFKVISYDPMSGTLETILRLPAGTRYETRRSVTRVSLFKEGLAPVW